MSNTGPYYTHEMHAKRCAEAARDHEVLHQYVQVDYYGQRGCGRIRDALDVEGHPMWKIESFNGLIGRVTVPVRLVRQCSGLDDKCQCEIAGK